MIGGPLGRFQIESSCHFPLSCPIKVAHDLKMWLEDVMNIFLFASSFMFLAVKCAKPCVLSLQAWNCFGSFCLAPYCSGAAAVRRPLRSFPRPRLTGSALWEQPNSLVKCNAPASSVTFRQVWILLCPWITTTRGRLNAFQTEGK